MPWTDEPKLEDMASGLPPSVGAYRHAWFLARKAVLGRAAHLKCGPPNRVGPKDLRLLFLAIDLFLFGSRYRTAFENRGSVEVAWCIDQAPSAPDCHLELHGEPAVPGRGLRDVFLEFYVAPERLEQEVQHGAPPLPDGETRGDLLDALMHAMLRLMILAASVVACGPARRGVATAASLLRRLRFEA